VLVGVLLDGWVIVYGGGGKGVGVDGV